MAIEDQVTQEILQDVNRFMDDVADRISQLTQENIVRKRIDDTGFLRGSVYVNRKFLEKEIGVSAKYAGAIEGGSNPHFPPVEPLKKWAQRKLRLGKKEASRAGWGTAQKIAVEGTEPKPFFRPAIEQTIQEFRAKEL